jgi:alanine racemase
MPPVTYCEIDLSAIHHNLTRIRQHIGPQVQMMVVVKANAYGHGAVRVAQTALEQGADRLAVNRLDEGIELRQAGINGPILVLGYTPPDHAPLAIAQHLTLTVTEIEQAQALNAAAYQSCPMHLKVDTGMGRLGVLPDEALSFAQALQQLPMLHLEGVFTHFSVADSLQADDQAYTRQQLARFLEVLGALEAAGIRIPIRHAANSAATMYYPHSHLDMVRVGIITYGLAPDAANPPAFPLAPALSLKSQVGRVKTLPNGASISYGRTFITSQPTRVALIPVGYGDGYHRLLSNRGAVLIGGQRAPILGRVCMDQFTVDISAIEGVQVGDEVVLIGRQGQGYISAEEVAAWAQTINYEVTTSLLPRPARVYR